MHIIVGTYAITDNIDKDFGRRPTINNKNSDKNNNALDRLSAPYLPSIIFFNQFISPPHLPRNSNHILSRIIYY